MNAIKSNIHSLLDQSSNLLKNEKIPSSRLDAEVLLAYVLGVDRTWLAAHHDTILQSTTLQQYEQLVKRRAKHEPVAYIIGKKEFYGREFMVTPSVLIPRPETEDVISLALSIGTERIRPKQCMDKTADTKPQQILDIGCGSGCIGITLKLERPEWDVTLVDISQKALAVAKRNAQELGAKTPCIQSDLLSSFIPRALSFSMIVANLPYVARAWQRSPETDHEPALALFAENGGLELVYKLVSQAAGILDEKGWLVLEADPEQHEDIVRYARKYRLKHVTTRGYAVSFVKQPSGSL